MSKLGKMLFAAPASHRVSDDRSLGRLSKSDQNIINKILHRPGFDKNVSLTAASEPGKPSKPGKPYQIEKRVNRAPSRYRS